jgi:hypothetical protein
VIIQASSIYWILLVSVMLFSASVTFGVACLKFKEFWWLKKPTFEHLRHLSPPPTLKDIQPELDAYHRRYDRFHAACWMTALVTLVLFIMSVKQGYTHLTTEQLARNNAGTEWASAVSGQSCIAWLGQSCANLAFELENKIVSRVTPITENPKARPIAYEVHAKIADPAVFANAIGVDSDPEVNGKRLANAVAFQLYELNNAHSKDMAKFYNPLDDAQRVELGSLVTGFVNPRLVSKGIAVTTLVSFTVDEPVIQQIHHYN